MPWRFTIGLILALFAGVAAAQEAPREPAAEPEAETPEKEDGPAVVRAERPEDVRVLKPSDVPAELSRLESKADIKVEVTVRTASGKPVVFKGVIRNGKLIERIVERRFVTEKELDKPQCGVRLWWAGDADGYIFFRYDTIESLAITGTFTKDDLKELMRRLRAKRLGESVEDLEQPPPEEVKAPDLEKMKLEERKAYLLNRYPEAEGWTDERKRELTRAQILDNQVLAPDEQVFVKYFPTLMQARFEEMRRHHDHKVRVEPGAADRDAEPESESGQ